MITINSNVDLGKSFESLKITLVESRKLAASFVAFNYLQAYENLAASVQRHIDICTVPESESAANIDDIKDFNI